MSLFGRIRKDGPWFIAECPALDIATQGRTAGEAKCNLMEATELFLVSRIERGTSGQAFRELRFERAKKR